MANRRPRQIVGIQLEMIYVASSGDRWHNTYLDIDAIKLVEATPRAAPRQALEKLGHSEVVQTVGAVEYHTLHTRDGGSCQHELAKVMSGQLVAQHSNHHLRTWMATALDKSLTVSVFPVPAGPSGAPP